MAELSTLARPYAKAAFSYAHENSVIGEWENFLLIASSVVSNSAFEQILDNPAVTADKKAEALISIFDEQVTSSQGQSTEKLSVASTSIKNFVLQLAEQDRLSLIPQVLEQFRSLRAIALKQVDVYVTSAYALDDAQRTMIQNRLEQSLNASVNLHEDIDSSLLAGATIKIGDKLVDDSVRGKLKQLKTTLTA